MAHTTKVPFKNYSTSDNSVVEKFDTVSKPETVSIVSLLNAKVKVTGIVTGNLYVWDKAGTALDVDVLDKDDILNKKRGRACCGGNSNALLFQLASSGE